MRVLWRPEETSIKLIGIRNRQARRRGLCACCSLVQFTRSGATYSFDLASAIGAEHEDRTVAAWAATPSAVARRDVRYQRGFPLTSPGAPVNREHLIPASVRRGVRPAARHGKSMEAPGGSEAFLVDLLTYQGLLRSQRAIRRAVIKLRQNRSFQDGRRSVCPWRSIAIPGRSSRHDQLLALLCT